MDTVNEVGKYLAKSREKADTALKKQSPEYGMADIARDVFDFQVPFQMHFRTPRKGMSVAADIQFEYPPPDAGTGNCCGDCYCAVCEQFVYGDVEDQILLLSRPYVPGSVRVYDPEGNSSNMVETDPEAGIIDLNYNPSTDASNYITVCYVHRYGTNCTDNTDPCYILDLFDDRTVGSGFGTSTSGAVWSSMYALDATASVSGGYGILTAESLAGGQVYLGITNTSETFVARENFTALIKFELAILPSTDQYVFFIESAGTSSTQVALYISNLTGQGYISTETGELTKEDWKINTPYYLLYDQTTTGIISIKLWEASDVEPSNYDIIDNTGKSFAAQTYFGVGLTDLRTGNAGSDSIIKIDSIKFNCPSEVIPPSVLYCIDNFDREIAASTSNTTLGTGSCLGTWTRYPQPVDTVVVPISVGVDGDEATFTYAGGTGGGTGRWADYVADGVVPEFPFEISFVVRSASFTNNRIELSIRPTGTNPETPRAIGADYTVTTVNTTQTVGMDIDDGSGPIGLEYGDGDYVDISRTFALNQQYKVRAYFESTGISMKVWPLSGAEPGTWDVAWVCPAGLLTDYQTLVSNGTLIWIEVWCHSSGATYIEYIDYTHNG